MRAQEGTARRYAKALHLAAKEAGVGEATGRELTALLEALQADTGALEILERPWIKPADRRAAARALAEKAGSGKLVRISWRWWRSADVSITWPSSSPSIAI